MDVKAKWRKRTYVWAYSYLGSCCVVCGSKDGLQFDHISAESKLFEISGGIRDGYGLSRLESELVKCQLLCLLHHQEKTRLNGEHAGGQNRISVEIDGVTYASKSAAIKAGVPQRRIYPRS